MQSTFLFARGFGIFHISMDIGASTVIGFSYSPNNGHLSKGILLFPPCSTFPRLVLAIAYKVCYIDTVLNEDTVKMR